MDWNIVVLGGKLAAVPELRTLDGGTTLLRYLVTLRSETPHHRIDVVPITLWKPPPELAAERPPPGHRIWAVGSLQRRFWPVGDSRRSRIEVVAHRVCLGEEPDIEPFVGPPDGPGEAN